MNDRERELAALAAPPDESIDTSDLPESEDWSNTERGRFWRPVKRSVADTQVAPFPRGKRLGCRVKFPPMGQVALNPQVISRR